MNFTFKWNDGAGMSTLMSVSGGLGPIIFRRKMARMRPVREEMDEEIVFPAIVGISAFDVCFVRVFSLLVDWPGVQTIMFSAKEKV